MLNVWRPGRGVTVAAPTRFSAGKARNMRSVYDLSTEEAYRLVADRLGAVLPSLDAVENEDWGRDYVLQHLQRLSPEELAALGLTWDSDPE